jgi:ATP-dependent DNA helicase
MQLRKICNHPYLFDMPDEEAEKDFDRHAALPPQHPMSVLTSSSNTSITSAVIPPSNIPVDLPDIVASSGKMLMLERLLPHLFLRGHKVLIFSQMTRMLDLMADWFEYVKKWKFCRIDGNVSIEDRRAQV